MPQLKYDCPHCGLRNAAFEFIHVNRLDTGRGSYRYDVISVMAECDTCSGGAVALYESDGPVDIHRMGHPDGWAPFEEGFKANYSLIELHPRRGVNRLSEHVPEEVSHAFAESEDAFLSGNAWGPAAMGYRNVLDLATKERGEANGNLQKRIEALHAAGKLTADLRDWAHEIRLDGNSAAHDPLTPEERKALANELREFVAIFLKFVYELPGRIRQRRAQTERAPDDVPHSA